MRYENPVDATDIPTLTVCISTDGMSFMRPEYKLELGKDFNLSYYTSSNKEHEYFTISSEGAKFNPDRNETLTTVYIQTEGKLCYKINQTNINPKIKIRGIKVIFDKSIKNPPKIFKFMVTSEDNAYGITMNKRMNGKFLQHMAKLGESTRMSIYAEKFLYLPEVSGCTNLSFWEIFEPFLYQKLVKKVSLWGNCSPISLPSDR